LRDRLPDSLAASCDECPFAGGVHSVHSALRPQLRQPTIFLLKTRGMRSEEQEGLFLLTSRSSLLDSFPC
jgi:hypothetical protein